MFAAIAQHLIWGAPKLLVVQLDRADQRQPAVPRLRVEQLQLALGFSSALELSLTRACDGASGKESPGSGLPRLLGVILGQGRADRHQRQSDGPI